LDFGLGKLVLRETYTVFKHTFSSRPISRAGRNLQSSTPIPERPLNRLLYLSLAWGLLLSVVQQILPLGSKRRSSTFLPHAPKSLVLSIPVGFKGLRLSTVH
jgi:hypothetical protein